MQKFYGFRVGLRYARWNVIILTLSIIGCYEEWPARAALGSESRLGR